MIIYLVGDKVVFNTFYIPALHKKVGVITKFRKQGTIVNPDRPKGEKKKRSSQPLFGVEYDGKLYWMAAQDIEHSWNKE